MSLTNTHITEENIQKNTEVTDNYMHAGWNVRQRNLILTVGTVVGALLSLKTCEKQPIAGEHVPTNVSSSQVLIGDSDPQ